MGDILNEFDEAAKRLKNRGGRPPWDNHPKDLHLALYAAQELSTRVRTQLEEHLAGCDLCRGQAEEIQRRFNKVTSHQEALAIAQEAIKVAEALPQVYDLVQLPLSKEFGRELVGSGVGLGTNGSFVFDQIASILVSKGSFPGDAILFADDGSMEIRISASPMKGNPFYCAMLPPGLQGRRFFFHADSPDWVVVPVGSDPRQLSDLAADALRTRMVEMSSAADVASEVDSFDDALKIVKAEQGDSPKSDEASDYLRRRHLTDAFGVSVLVDGLEFADQNPTTPAVEVIENHRVMDPIWWKKNPWFKEMRRTYAVAKRVLPVAAIRRLVVLRDSADEYNAEELSAMRDTLADPVGDVHWVCSKNAMSLDSMDCAVVARERVFRIRRSKTSNSFEPLESGEKSAPDAATAVCERLEKVIAEKAVPMVVNGVPTSEARKAARSGSGVRMLIEKLAQGKLSRERPPKSSVSIRVEQARNELKAAIQSPSETVLVKTLKRSVETLAKGAPKSRREKIKTAFQKLKI